jgi:hypothetical protein
MVRYFQNATLNGVGIDGEYKKCEAAREWYYKTFGVYTTAGEAIAAAKADVNGLVVYLGRGGGSCYCGCTYTYCNDFGTTPILPNEVQSIVTSKSQRIIPGARAVYNFYREGCIGGSTPGCPGTVNGASPQPHPQGYGAFPDLDQMAGGFGPRNLAFTPVNCGYSGCGPSCIPIGSTSSYGSKIFSTLQGGPIASLAGVGGSPPPPCECIQYNIEKCSTYSSPECAECVRRDMQKFNYNFEQGNYTFNLNGHKVRDLPINPFTSVAPFALDWPSFTNCSGLGWGIPPNNDENSATEVCTWFESPGFTSIYDIYQSVTTTTYDIDLPKCPILLLTIDYDNNYTKIITNTGKVLCFENKIQNNCPKLFADLHNSKYYITNNIDSKCSSCSVEPADIKLTSSPTVQNWEFIIEQRIAIIGDIIPLEGDLNQDMAGGATSYIDIFSCGANSQGVQPCNVYLGFGGAFQCGKSSPESFPWSYCLKCSVPGSQGPELKQIYGGSDLTSFIHGGLVSNCARMFFRPEASNGLVKQKFIEDWKKYMNQVYQDIAPCQNNRSLNHEDIIEGILPGSCQLNFSVVSIPYLAARRTAGASESRGGSAGFHVAYVSYQYKRPKTEQDLLLDKCTYTYNSSSTTLGAVLQTPNMVEKYFNEGPCKNTISCKDTIVENCDKTNYCCRQGI